MRNLIDSEFFGTMLPVNPKYQTMHGQACFESVSALETGVDLAVIATPMHSVADIVGECVEKKIVGAFIISTGVKKVDEQGREIEDKIQLDCAEFMAKQPRPRRPRLAILTNGGEPGVMTADALARFTQIDYERQIALMTSDEDSQPDSTPGGCQNHRRCERQDG